MKHFLFCISSFIILCASCDTVTSKTKNTINKSGEALGNTATEFFEGVSEGFDKALACDISLSEDLKQSGLKTGKFSIENHTSGGKNNQLTLYLIFDQDLEKTLVAKAYDKNALEIGRAKAEVKGKTGEATYVDFVFDSRTYIEVKSKITIE